jgi:hypothetical protein
MAAGLTCRSQRICGVSTYHSRCLQKPTHGVNNAFSCSSTYIVVRTRLLLSVLPRILFLLCNLALDNLASNLLHQHHHLSLQHYDRIRCMHLMWCIAPPGLLRQSVTSVNTGDQKNLEWVERKFSRRRCIVQQAAEDDRADRR